MNSFYFWLMLMLKNTAVVHDATRDAMFDPDRGDANVVVSEGSHGQSQTVDLGVDEKRHPPRTTFILPSKEPLLLSVVFFFCPLCSGVLVRGETALNGSQDAGGESSATLLSDATEASTTKAAAASTILYYWYHACQRQKRESSRRTLGMLLGDKTIAHSGCQLAMLPLSRA